MSKLDFGVGFIWGILAGIILIITVTYNINGYTFGDVNDEYREILEHMDCDEMYEYSYDNDVPIMKDFVVENCIYDFKRASVELSSGTNG